MAGIIDGRQWLEKRLRHLQAQLEADPPEDERKLIEAEIERLGVEAGSRRRRFRRWLVWGGPHQ